MRHVSIALIALMAFFCGCDDQNEEPGNLSPLISIDFGGYLVEGAKGYVVVTDTLNNVITKAEIVNSTHVDILPQDNFKGESINAFFVLQTPDFYHTTAYLRIKRGSSYNFEGKPVYGMKNPIQLQFTDVPPFDYLTVGTDAGARTYRNSDLADTANYGTRFNYLEGGKIYAQVVNNGQGKFGFLPITDDQSTYQVSIAELDQTSLRSDITVPEDNLYGSYFLIGYEATGNVESYYWLFETPLYGPSFSIFYPSYSFTEYISSLSLNTGDKYLSYTRIGDIVETYARPKFSSETISGFPNSFKHAPIGEFDYYNAEFNHPNGDQFVHVFAPHYIRSFSIPDFSSYLSLPPRDYTKYKLQSLSLVDVLGHVEDESYFKLYSAYPNSPAPENVDRVSYQF
jgi:hypothetical protein